MDYWNHVLWSDETKINLFGSDGVKRVWRQPGEEYKDKCVCLQSSMVVGVSGAAWVLPALGSYSSLRETTNANMYCDILKQSESVSESDVTYGQVWWPILWIRALAFNPIQSAHNSSEHTHPRSSGQPFISIKCATAAFMLRRPGSSWGFGALLKGTSVVVLRVERALYIHSPHLQFLPDLRLELATFGLRVQLSNHKATTSPEHDPLPSETGPQGSIPTW